MQRWLLPEYIEDILPAEALRIEGLRRRILDLFRAQRYELVMPPMLEYLESLLTGTGHDLDLRTFKLVDQLSGRLLGLRADITPQVARIDAHLLNREGVTRLCYAGTVAHADAQVQVLTGDPGRRNDAELFVDGQRKVEERPDRLRRGRDQTRRFAHARSSKGVEWRPRSTMSKR